MEAEEAGGDITGTGAGEVTEVVATTWTSVRLVKCSTVHWTRCNVYCNTTLIIREHSLITRQVLTFFDPLFS